MRAGDGGAGEAAVSTASLRLLATKAAPTAKSDALRFVRADGTECAVAMPRQGVLPHDLLHWVVESGLALPGGFLSLVAAGAAADFAMTTAHDPRSPQATAQALQAESLVEALQTQLWSGAFDDAAFAYGAQTAAEARGITPWPGLQPGHGERLFAEAQALHLRWLALPPGATLQLDFEPT